MISQTKLIPYLSDLAIVDLFDQYVSSLRPLLDQTRSLMKKNATLHRTRDLLLPRLISGEVNVSELDIKNNEEIA